MHDAACGQVLIGGYGRPSREAALDHIFPLPREAQNAGGVEAPAKNSRVADRLARGRDVSPESEHFVIIVEAGFIADIEPRVGVEDLQSRQK